MTKKIFRSIMAVTITVLMLSLVITVGFLYSYFNEAQVDRLKDSLSFAIESSEVIDEEYLKNLKSSEYRFTLVMPDGTVLYDTEADASSMENHLEREEIKEALESGAGSSKRHSSTLTEMNYYEAVLLENGNVLRISVRQMTLGALILNLMPPITAILLVAIVVSLLLSDQMAKAILQPLGRLDLENPAENDAYEELSPILSKLSRQRRQIDRQMLELRQKTDEFEQITSSMNEGLVILDNKGRVISINPAAKRLFDITSETLGNGFLTIDRSPEMSKAIDLALSGGKNSEFRESRNDHEYQFLISRTESDGRTVGAVILVIDISEIAFAERSRREFTANVSHELKTPLQSIIGSAELLENGLVRTEDTPRFVGNIKNEATRLVSLINDIIRLSQLDENSSPATESVDLYALASEVVSALSDSAEKKNVRISLSGESCVMNGIRRYLYEIVYNLCDNAIRYNKDGGEVMVSAEKSAAGVRLTVSDTGLGIAPEHHQRIFERFYRVDKSHSKETGGTGLGLSIVKHAVQYHCGKISLSSTPDIGTTITIEF